MRFDFADLLPTTAINVLSSIPDSLRSSPILYFASKCLVQPSINRHQIRLFSPCSTRKRKAHRLSSLQLRLSWRHHSDEQHSITTKLQRASPASSIATTDLTVNVGAVSSFTIIDAQTIQFVLSGISAEGQLSISTASGAFVVSMGNSAPPFLLLL